MPLFSSLTAEDAAVLIALFAPSAAALFWLGVNHKQTKAVKG
jgi:hypothetical protein